MNFMVNTLSFALFLSAGFKQKKALVSNLFEHLPFIFYQTESIPQSLHSICFDLRALEIQKLEEANSHRRNANRW